MQGELDHIVLNVEDEGRMTSFYTEIIELKPERLDEYRAGKAAFPSVRLNADTIIDLFPKKLWAGADSPGKVERTNLNHFCIVLAQRAWEKLRQRLAAHHITIEEGPVERWGAHGKGLSIYFRDPEKNLIEAKFYGEQG